MGILNITQTNASRHLNYLKNAGLVEAKRQEQWVIYSLKKDMPKPINKVIEATLEAVSELCDLSDIEERLRQIMNDKDYRLKHIKRR